MITHDVKWSLYGNNNVNENIMNTYFYLNCIQIALKRIFCALLSEL